MSAAEPFPNLASVLGADGTAGSSHMPQHNRELTLRRYLLLQEEQQYVRRHLDELSATTSQIQTTTTTPSRSPSRAGGHKRTDSAARRASMPQYDAPRPRIHARSRRHGAADPVALSVAVDPVMLAEIDSEEAKLFSINEGIKRSLTELLNCETVRSDQAFRQWIMSRLMEVERELRVGRRRRSCPTE